MTPPVDPIRTRGRWLVTTASGALHLIDSASAPDAVTATRVTAGPIGDDPRFPRGSLRRDDQAVRVTSIQHLAGRGMVDGIVVGEDMYLTLEPLDPSAYETVRRTTPVLSIETLEWEV